MYKHSKPRHFVMSNHLEAWEALSGPFKKRAYGANPTSCKEWIDRVLACLTQKRYVTPLLKNCKFPFNLSFHELASISNCHNFQYLTKVKSHALLSWTPLKQKGVPVPSVTKSSSEQHIVHAIRKYVSSSAVWRNQVNKECRREWKAIQMWLVSEDLFQNVQYSTVSGLSYFSYYFWRSDFNSTSVGADGSMTAN